MVTGSRTCWSSSKKQVRKQTTTFRFSSYTKFSFKDGRKILRKTVQNLADELRRVTKEYYEDTRAFPEISVGGDVDEFFHLAMGKDKSSSKFESAFAAIPELRIWATLANADTVASLAIVLAGNAQK